MILELPFIPGVPEQLIRSINERLRAIPTTASAVEAPVLPQTLPVTSEAIAVTINGIPVNY